MTNSNKETPAKFLKDTLISFQYFTQFCYSSQINNVHYYLNAKYNIFF